MQHWEQFGLQRLAQGLEGGTFYFYMPVGSAEAKRLERLGKRMR